MAVRDDLATLRGIIECPNQDAPMHTRVGCTFCATVGPAVDALSRVEADLARLEEALSRADAECGEQHARAVRAEAEVDRYADQMGEDVAEVTRLREGLRRIAETGDALSGVSPEADIARSLLDDNQEASA